MSALALVAACAPVPSDPGTGTTIPSTTEPTTTTATTTTTSVPVSANPPVVAAQLGRRAVDLSWTDSTAVPPVAYEVQWRGADSGEWAGQVFTTSRSVSVTGLSGPANYVFRVRAVTAAHVAAGEFSSEVAVEYYALTLPIVRIDTNDVAIADKETYVPATLDIDPNGSELAEYHGTLGIRGRGNSTWNYAKKPYRLKLDTKAPLLGLPADKDWVLLANHVDKSQMRNRIANELSEATDLAWTPTLRHVEVILNGRYDGVYQLGEHVKVDSDRIDIDEMKATDTSGSALTGGYLLEIDGRLEQNDEPGFRTAGNVPIVVKDPDPATAEQRTYIQGVVQDFETALYSPTFADPATGFRAHVDMDSFIDAYLVQELTRQQDAFGFSSYFTKPRSGKLEFGPLWDFDLSMGSTAPGLAAPSPPTGWGVRIAWRNWIPRFFADPTFVAEVSARWNQLVPAFRSVAAGIDPYATTIEQATANDEARWGYATPASDEASFLSAWLTTRIDWMDANL